MKTVTAKSADGKRKMRVPIVAEKGPLSVARGADLRPGKRALEKFWRVYHTKSGAAFIPFTNKAATVKAMNLMAGIRGNWDRPFEVLNKDKKLAAKYAEVLARIKVEFGEWIKLS